MTSRAMRPTPPRAASAQPVPRSLLGHPIALSYALPLACLAAGCETEKRADWRVLFACEQAAQDVALVRTRVLSKGCDGDPVYEAELPRDGSNARNVEPPGKLPPGTYGFEATSLDASGEVVDKACRVFSSERLSQVELVLSSASCNDSGAGGPDGIDAGPVGIDAGLGACVDGSSRTCDDAPEGGIEDGGGGCETRALVRPQACTISSPAVDCQETIDGDLGTWLSLSCSLYPDACSFRTEPCTSEGCLQDVTLKYTFSEERMVDRLRFRSDVFDNLPNEWQLWVSSDETLEPYFGATLVTEGTGHPPYWVCVTGASCTPAYVPDECCPAGRDAPQAPPHANVPLWNDYQFVPAAGRVWWLRIPNMQDADMLLLNEVEFFSAPCKAQGPDRDI